MRLCLACGLIDVDAAAAAISDRQLTEWMAFDSYVEPFEDRRQDTRIGLLACALESIWTGRHELTPSLFALSGSDNGNEGQECEGLQCDDWRVMQARAGMTARG